MTSLPLAAQACVIVYNLAGVTDGSLILTTAVTARIFMGNITKWNDVAITSLNPSLTLPNSNITLVSRGDVNAMNSIFNTGMGSLYPQWKTTVIQSGGVINFPVKTNLVVVKNFFAHGTALSTIANSISYMMLDEVRKSHLLSFIYGLVSSPRFSLCQ
jgi:ABC-type phosphate transport system substrate-binding protein